MLQLHIVDVAEILRERGIRVPTLPFLSSDPGFIRILMLQPRAIVLAEATGIRVQDQPRLTAQVDKFLQEAVNNRVDLAFAPEYCCPWDSVVRAVESGVIPANGKLWAIGCQSLTRASFTTIKNRLEPLATILVEEAAFDEAGDFIDPLVYIFCSMREDESQALIILIQPKTHPMGGGEHFEYTHLQTGSRLYRFIGPGERPNRLVGLVCSDVLHPRFAAEVNALHHETLILHAQLNPDSSPPPYRAYRTSCCTIAPRSAEILALNWALGTQLEAHNGPQPFIDEPRSMLLRSTQEIDTSDETFIANHLKGVYLTNWRPYRTAAYLFSPDEHLHLFETTKPSLVGPPTNTIRTGPRGLAVFDWRQNDQTWAESGTPPDDRFHTYWLTQYEELKGILQPIAHSPSTIERLISLSLGKALSDDWDHWSRMDTYELAEDETPCRLTICWSKAGSGYAFRADSLARFRSFASVVNAPQNFSNRLIEFKTSSFQVTYKNTTAAKRFQNLHLDQGISATVIYLGQTPPIEVVQRVVTETVRLLKYYGSDSEKVAIWSLEADGLKDHMDKIVPLISEDPDVDPADIAKA